MVGSQKPEDTQPHFWHLLDVLRKRPNSMLFVPTLNVVGNSTTVRTPRGLVCIRAVRCGCGLRAGAVLIAAQRRFTGAVALVVAVDAVSCLDPEGHELQLPALLHRRTLHEGTAKDSATIL